jgi:hypothetical protein
MNKIQEFFDSPVFANLKDGKLPEMEVQVDLKPEALLNLFAGAFFTAVAIILVSKILRKL